MFRTSYDSEMKIWSGRHLTPLHHESVSLGRVIFYTLSLNRGEIAQISDNNGLSVTNGEICDQMLTIASNLIDRNVKRDSVIAIMAKNGHLIAPTIFATFFLAIPVNSLDPNYSVDEAAHMFSQTRPSIVFCDHENYETVKCAIEKVGGEIRVINFGERISNVDNIDDYLVKTGREKSLQPVDVDAKTCVLILCSSGTTGRAKGVRLSHQHILYQIGFPALLEDWEIDGAMFSFSSLYWISGLYTLLISTFYGMRRIITTELFDADLFLKIIPKYKVTHLIITPMQAAKILESESISAEALSSVRELLIGGSVVPKDTCANLQSYLTNGSMCIAYGMSEVGYISRQTRTNNTYSVGQIAPDLKLKIVNDNNENLAVEEMGEICFKPRYRFLGYHGNEEATTEMIDEDNWVHSGDIGKVDEDGYLHVMDRKKEILKYNNYHVSPSEIEGIIITHPEVIYVAVVGIPDRVYTDLPAAVVVRKEGASVSEKDIYDLVASKLSETKYLRGGVYFVDQLPLTPSGKVLKTKVKEMAIEFYKSRH